MEHGMIAEAYQVADKLENECEPYIPLDEITFIKAASLLRRMAEQNQLLKSQLIFEKLKNKLTKNDKFH
jgi:hypothetical protein